jgi:uncharacterized protein YkwD
MRRLSYLSLIAAAAILTVQSLAGCGGSGTASPEHAGATDIGWSADELRAERVVNPTTTAPTTTSTVPPTTTSTTSTTAPPPPPTTVATSPPAVVAAAAAPAPPPPPPAPQGGDEARALQLINQERAGAGLPPLQPSAGARSVARSWSAHMAGTGLAHNPDLSGDLARAGVTTWSTIGENVGYGGSVDQIHGMFMGSSGHRANILKAAYSLVGIGVVRDGGTVWITLDFVG